MVTVRWGLLVLTSRVVTLVLRRRGAQVARLTVPVEFQDSPTATLAVGGRRLVLPPGARGLVVGAVRRGVAPPPAVGLALAGRSLTVGGRRLVLGRPPGLPEVAPDKGAPVLVTVAGERWRMRVRSWAWSEGQNGAVGLATYELMDEASWLLRDVVTAVPAELVGTVTVGAAVRVVLGAAGVRLAGDVPAPDAEVAPDVRLGNRWRDVFRRVVTWRQWRARPDGAVQFEGPEDARPLGRWAFDTLAVRPLRDGRARTAGETPAGVRSAGAGLPVEWAGKVDDVAAEHAAHGLGQVAAEYGRRRVVAGLPRPGEWGVVAVPGRVVGVAVECDHVRLTWRGGDLDVSWTALSESGVEDATYGGR